MSKTILIIEDDKFLSGLLRSRLEKEGTAVVPALNGEEALRFLKSEKPALILLDLILPDKSGFEVMKAIKSDPRLEHIPIIIISNLSKEADIKMGKEMGAVEYFVKAKISLDQLVEEIKKFNSSR